MKTPRLQCSLFSIFVVFLYCGISLGILMHANDVIQVAVRGSIAIGAVISAMIAVMSSGVIRRTATVALALPLIHLFVAYGLFNADIAPELFPSSWVILYIWKVFKIGTKSNGFVDSDIDGSPVYNLYDSGDFEAECFIDIGMCLFSIFIGLIGSIVVFNYCLIKSRQ